MKNCDICFEEQRGVDVSELQCSHSFCRDCMMSHVKAQIEQGIYPRCQMFKPLPPHIQMLMQSSSCHVKGTSLPLLTAGTASFVAVASLLCRCPDPDCKKKMTSQECINHVVNKLDHLLFSQARPLGLPYAEPLHCCLTSDQALTQLQASVQN